MKAIKTSNENATHPLAMSYALAKSIAIAVDYKFDELISNEGLSITSLAKACRFNPAALLHLLRVLDASEIIILDADHVGRGPLIDQLDDVRSMHVLGAYKAFDELEYTLKTHKPAWDKVYGKPFYETLTPEETAQFALWCQKSAKAWLAGVFSLYDFSSYQSFVDVGGGNGYFLSQILKRFQYAKGKVLDQPSILEESKAVFEHAACLDRVEIVPGDFFKSVPEGGDLYTICRTLLNWSDDDAIKILNECAAAMNENAKLLIIDFMLPERDHPHYMRTALSDLNLFTIMNSANRTEQEWRALVDKSDLTLNNVIISPLDLKPEPIAPIIFLECGK